jgi:AAA domain-containing protein
MNDVVKAFGDTYANSPYPFTLLRDLQPVLNRREIVRDLIPRRALGEVHADSSGGKTAIMVDLALHIAAGIEYRGRRVEQQPVVYVALEGHGGIDNRVIAAGAELGIEDAPFALVKTGDNFRFPEPAQRVASVARQLLKSHGGDCPLIVIDTYTAALGADGSDCDPKDVSAFIAAIQQHLLRTCTTLILHHFGKDSSRGGRGWSGLRAALDFELEIHQTDDGLRTMRVTKSRDGSDQQPGLCFRLHGREIGINEHGEPVTAVVVEHLADEEVAKRGKRIKPGSRAALNVLWQMIKDPSRSFPLPDQPGLRCVLLTAWEDECTREGGISKSPDIKQRRRMFRDALADLEHTNLIIRDADGGERVYPMPSRDG